MAEQKRKTSVLINIISLVNNNIKIICFQIFDFFINENFLINNTQYKYF